MLLYQIKILAIAITNHVASITASGFVPNDTYEVIAHDADYRHVEVVDIYAPTISPIRKVPFKWTLTETFDGKPPIYEIIPIVYDPSDPLIEITKFSADSGVASFTANGFLTGHTYEVLASNRSGKHWQIVDMFTDDIPRPFPTFRQLSYDYDSNFVPEYQVIEVQP